VGEQGGARRRRVEVEERRAGPFPSILPLPHSLLLLFSEAFETLRRATGAWPATNIRQGYACLLPSLPILLREIKHPNP
jgi:hypothetical protein